MKTAGSGVGLLAAGTGLGSLTSTVARAASSATTAAGAASSHAALSKGELIPFWGSHQAGIVTAQQNHTYFAAFDLVSKKRDEVEELLKRWTEASAAMAAGRAIEVPKLKSQGPGAAANPSPSSSSSNDAQNAKNPDAVDSSYESQSTADSGEAQSLPASRLTLTFGFGRGLFVTKEGADRYGLAKFLPEALVDMPKFHGDELIDSKTGGDLSVQACSDDPQVAFHAIRHLARIASGVAQIRWTQTGFVSPGDGKETPRNLMGFKDGTQQPKDSERDKFVWVGSEGPAWMRGGSYLVTRRIRVALEHWDGTEVGFQEQVMGRYKKSGAPLGQRHEREPMNLSAVDKDGSPVIPENAHVRMATAATNGGAQILRRGYSYNDGVNVTAERWPPWRQGLEYDAGLFFVAYQSDPRTGFIKIFQNMAKLDALNQFATHVGSGLFACPPGAKPGESIGQKLFEAV